MAWCLVLRDMWYAAFMARDCKELHQDVNRLQHSLFTISVFCTQEAINIYINKEIKCEGHDNDNPKRYRESSIRACVFLETTARCNGQAK